MIEATAEQLRADKSALLAQLLAEETVAAPPPDPGRIQPLAPRTDYPLSFAQRRLWFLDQLEANPAAYNVPLAYRLTGSLDIAALVHALTTVVNRHTALHTVFAERNGEPAQQVLSAVLLPLPIINLVDLPAPAQATELAQQLTDDVRRPFDLSSDLPLRATLYQLSGTEHVLSLTLHHIACDAWSVGILLRELSAAYRAALQDSPPDLPDLPVQYPDYAVWQHTHLHSKQLTQQITGWQTRLADLPALSLPTDLPRPAAQTFRGDTRTLVLDRALIEQLRRLGREAGGTLFTALLAGFKILLHRYAKTNDVFVGSPVANRNRPETENLIGFFTNTLVLRTRLAPEMTFRQSLRKVQTTVNHALAAADVPFEKLVEALHPTRDLSRSPLFQVMFSHQTASPLPELPGVSAEPVTVPTGTAKFDLNLAAIEDDTGVTLALEFSTDLFTAATADRMLHHLRCLLTAAAAYPGQTVADLPLMDQGERAQVVAGWNHTTADTGWQTAVHHRFEAQAVQTPQAVAVRGAGREFTYTELNQKANRLAHLLRNLGVKPDTPVGICLPPSPERVTAVLAVLKAGGACLPLDPGYPQERLNFMLADTGAPLLLTRGPLVQRFHAAAAALLDLDYLAHRLAAESPENLPGRTFPDHLAYVMYTSGSSGRPKGVALPHRALSNLIGWQFRRPNLSRPAITLQFTPLSFDVSFQEIFSALCSGGTLVTVDSRTRRNPERLARFIAEHAIERLFLPFVALQQLAETMVTRGIFPAALQDVVTAGEALQATPAIRHLFRELPQASLHNHYGPTESHVVTAHTLPPNPDHWPVLPPIGRPIANVQVYLLDEHCRPVPIGIPGELYIGGAALARGYWHRPDLTRERFIPSPFAAGERLYKTGDVARYRPDGCLQFLGRLDNQLKIRGFRVEPGEIEAALRRHPQIEACAVSAHRTGGELRLAAYVSAPDSLEVAGLRNFLRDKLPEHMIPAVFVRLDSLPLTPSGKVDRRALPPPVAPTCTDSAEAEPPQTPAERKVAQIWTELLDIPQVNRRDNFFELGGHSLLAVRLFAKIEETFGRRLPLETLFRLPTLAEFAAALTAERDSEPSPDPLLVPIQPRGNRPPLFLVHGFGGSVLEYGQLPRHLPAEQPLFGLQARGLNGDAPPHTSVPEMAAAYIRAVKRVQPVGPYRLGGYCFGGTVAFEMARQLQAQGEHVALLAVIEGYAPGIASIKNHLLSPGRWRQMAANFPAWLHDYRRLGRRLMLRRLRRKVTLLGKQAAQNIGLAPSIELTDVMDDLNGASPVRQRLMEVQLTAMTGYAPAPYAGQVTLLRVQALSLLYGHDPLMGWGRLATGGVQVRMISGAHGDILQPPHIESLARRLQDCLTDIGD